MSCAPLVIEKIVTHPVRIPYPRPIRWGAHSEDCADYLLLEIVTTDGLSGVAEGTVKTNWTGVTLRSLSVTIDEVFAPRLAGIDITQTASLRDALDRVPENRLAKSMIDVACWDLRAQAIGKPLWRLWEGDRTVPVSWTVTRQQPADMVHDAARKVAAHGFQMLKIKTGQGRETDFAMLDEIRRTVGDGIRLYADSNGAYQPADVPDFTAGLKDRGIFLAEDPCNHLPDAAFERLRQASALPLLVDNNCRSLLDASLFLERGAEAISIKIGKSGLSESVDIIAAAQRRGARSHVGMLGESSLGSLVALQLAGSIVGREQWLPAESSFFLTLPQEFMLAPLLIKDGAIVLPDEPSMHALVDWERVRALHP